VDTPLWDSRPTLKKQFGYHPKLAISARVAAEAELDSATEASFNAKGSAKAAVE
jgi:hypothetical protein